MKGKIKITSWLFLVSTIIFSCVGNNVQKSSATTCPQIDINTTYYNRGKFPINKKRDRIYLNGIWKFVPALNGEQKPPAEGWGTISVPGDWQQEKNPIIPGLNSRGQGNRWSVLDQKKNLSKAWYEYTAKIPSDWQGRSILLDITRVSTDAIIYINGLPCGQIDWPYGTIDLTQIAKPGQEITISLLVTAVAEAKNKSRVLVVDESSEIKLDTKGIIGEVSLISVPQGPLISDVFIQTSTRNQKIQLDMELANVTKAGPVKILAKIYNDQGKIEQQFETQANIQAATKQNLRVSWPWPNPRLWDLGQPNLYNLQLSIEGENINDEYQQTFGFREFWIEGRKFYLNGSEIRWRPTVLNESWISSIPEVTDKMIDGYLYAGFNLGEMWPWNHNERGKFHFRELFAERADSKGFPLIAPALRMSHIRSPELWNQSNRKATWEKNMLRELRRYRNHPSILMWANSPSSFGHGDDQNPQRIGIKTVAGNPLDQKGEMPWREVAPIGEEVIKIIKQQDPTRPVIMHQGASVGDVYALNSYLNIIPLQEREEWLSHWAKYGDMPYMVLEFGTPLHTTMMRSRQGFGVAVISEPLMTEYTAIYFGDEAYQLETNAYRQKIKEFFVKNQFYRNWQSQPELDFAPAFQKLQELFNTNTWRSWRTFGITGGMIPWNNGHGWEIAEQAKTDIDISPFFAGRRGPYLPKIRSYFSNYLQPQGYVIHPGGRALMANNGPTLAWIGGEPNNFVAKDHRYKSGQKLQKQVILINDTRNDQNFSFQWQIIANAKNISTGNKKGKINLSETLFFPIDMLLPNVTTKTEGEIILNAKIGDRNHQDRFPFRIFPSDTTQNSQGKPSLSIQVFDPVGKTTKMLKQLGYTVTPWDGGLTNSLLIIGRESLSNNNKLPGNLEAFIRNGGKAIIFTQKPEWIKQALGLRVAPHLSRRVFSVATNHPVVKGLDNQDLRDWKGESTLIEAYPDIINRQVPLNPRGSPWHGWHWSNRGAVSSASIEKPHYSSWRPILQSEFDLAYTPLMEMDYGHGRLILNTLDLEDHVSLDPAADQLLQQIISYGNTQPLAPKANKVVFIGDLSDQNKLDKTGLIYDKANGISTDAQLTIIGEKAKVNEAELRSYVSSGGKVLFLPRRSTSEILGVKIGQVKNFGGSLKIPQWPETRGLSISDLRTRSFYDAWLIQSGGEIASDGLLSRLTIGSGVAFFTQLDPDSLQADTQTYLRFTRWRYTRAISQILANLGASFKVDQQFINLSVNPNLVYHPDYLTDFNFGDDPYRYYRW